MAAVVGVAGVGAVSADHRGRHRQRRAGAARRCDGRHRRRRARAAVGGRRPGHGRVGRVGGDRLHELDDARPPAARRQRGSGGYRQQRGRSQRDVHTVESDRGHRSGDRVDVTGPGAEVQDRIRCRGRAIDQTRTSRLRPPRSQRVSRPSARRTPASPWSCAAPRTCRVSRPTSRYWRCASRCRRTTAAGSSTT